MSTTFVGDFAALVPVNTLAKQLFSRCYTYVEKEDSFHFSFMVALPTEHAPASDEPVESDTSYDSYHTSDDPDLLMAGAYVLSFEEDRGPEMPRLGWRSGRGSRKFPSRNVDLLLARPRDNSSKSLASLHFRLRVSEYSGLLMLCSTQGYHDTQKQKDLELEISVDGHWECLPPREERLLFRRSSVIRVGRCKYEVQYTIPIHHRETFLEMRNTFIGKRLEPETNNFMHIAYLPGDDITVRGRYLQLATHGRGTFGWVSQGIDTRSGRLIAIKEVRIESQKSWPSVQQEVQMGRRFQAQIGLLPLLDAFCEHGKPDACIYPEKYYLHFPFALNDWSRYFLHHQDIAHCSMLELLEQPLQGLATMHRMGIIHRDIRPENILVLSYDPPVAAICDYGKAIDAKLSTQTTIGPIHTLAPEVWTSNGQDPYTELIDVWAYGYAVAQILGYRDDSGNNQITLERHASIHSMLCAHTCEFPERADLVELAACMLAWSVLERLTAADALKHRCWDVIRTLTDLGSTTAYKSGARQDPAQDL